MYLYQVYKLGGNAIATLSLLSLGSERKVKCYNKYFVNGYMFHTEEYGQGKKIYNSGFCVKGLTSSEFKVDYYRKLEEVIELQYYSKHNRVFLFNVIRMTPLTKELEYISIMVWSKLTLKLDSATLTMSLFSPRNARKFITHTLFPLEMIGQELISYPY